MRIGRIKFNTPKITSSRKSRNSKSKTSGTGVLSAKARKARNADTQNRKTGGAKNQKTRGTKNPKLSFWGVSARVVMIVFASLLVLSCASVFFNPAKLWLMNLLGLLFLPLFLINIVLFCWAARKRSWSSVIPLVAIIPSCFFFTRYVQPFHKTVDESVSDYVSADAPTSKSADAGQSSVAHDRIYDAAHPQNQIRILSYNVGRFALSSAFKNVRECSDSLFMYLSQTDSDIICLQEYYGLDSKDLERYVRRYLPGYAVNSYMFSMRRGCFGNVTLSRLPVVDKGKVLFPESRNLAIYTEYVSDGDRFRVYNCHLESYAVSLANIWKILKGDKQVFMETGQRMRRSILRRPQQVDNVLSSIESCHLKSFVCGDFNDSPISNTYYRVSHGREDSFVKAGHGFGASFGPFWPFIRIDYIFSPDEYTPVSHYTPKVKYSDHYPVISDIRLGGSI